MKHVWRLLAVTTVLVAVASAVPAFASDTTVGDFVVKLAETKSLRASDAPGAVDALRTVGIRLPEDLNLQAPLTEGDVTRIAAVSGLSVRTSRPERSFGRLQVERFFASFSDELAADQNALLRDPDGPENPGQGGGPGNGNGGPPFDPFSKGKGKHKGKAKAHETPSEPE